MQNLCIGYIVMGSYKGKRNHYIKLAKFLYCKLPVSPLGSQVRIRSLISEVTDTLVITMSVCLHCFGHILQVISSHIVKGIEESTAYSFIRIHTVNHQPILTFCSPEIGFRVYYRGNQRMLWLGVDLTTVTPCLGVSLLWIFISCNVFKVVWL